VQLNDSVFYRGVADAGEYGSALAFASNEQLELECELIWFVVN